MARAVAGPGWFLAGDAAAVLDPASSHGVLRAVLTGFRAGQVAMDHLPEAGAFYDGRFRAAVKADCDSLWKLFARWTPGVCHDTASRQAVLNT